MSVPTDDKLRDLLNVDAFQVAEEMTGKNHNDDDETSNIGIGIHQLIGEAKENLLQSTDDTYRNIPFEDTLRIIRGEGFVELTHWYVNRYAYNSDEIGTTDVSMLFFHTSGIYLVAESYGKKTNSIRITYNIRYKAEYSEKFFADRRVREKAEKEKGKPLTYFENQEASILDEQDNIAWKAFCNTGGLMIPDEHHEEVYAVADGVDCLEGLRLKLSEILSQNYWHIMPYMISYGHFVGLCSPPPATGIKAERDIEQYKKDRYDFLIYIISNIDDERHAYLKDVKSYTETMEDLEL